MAIVHIVLFEFKTTTDEEKVQDACQRMLALREKCVHPTSQKPYVKSSTGGKNNSPESHAGGLTHGFVVEFENEQDRQYYLTKDPEHLAFVDFIGNIVEKVTVLDYTPGIF